MKIPCDVSCNWAVFGGCGGSFLFPSPLPFVLPLLLLFHFYPVLFVSSRFSLCPLPFSSRLLSFFHFLFLEF